MLKSTSSPKSKRQAGFTLIEVLIVVAIVGILTAIALPNYSRHVQNSRRGDAAAMLMQNLQYMQRFYAANNSYAKTLAGDDPVLPRTQSPDSGAAAYNLSFSGNRTRTTFLLQAVPTGSMAGDRCGTLSINQLGQRFVTAGTVADCWR